MKRITMLLWLVLGLAGCTMLPAPGQDLADHTPVANLGEVAPPDKRDYILRIPAGQALPITLHLAGGLFQRGRDIKTEVRLTRDLYLYKYWASYDGRHWRKWNELVGVKVGSGVGTDGAKFNVTLNVAKGG